MNEIFKRILSGAVYVAVMLLGTLYSELSFHILFVVILLICLYEMYMLRKGKTKIIPIMTNKRVSADIKGLFRQKVI